MVPDLLLPRAECRAVHPGHRRLSDQAQHHHYIHVDRADAQRGEPDIRRICVAVEATERQVFVFFVMVVAAAEAAVGLAIIICRVPYTRNVERRRVDL